MRAASISNFYYIYTTIIEFSPAFIYIHFIEYFFSGFYDFYLGYV